MEQKTKTFRGIDARTYARTQKVPCTNGEFCDHESGMFRPGAWEWETEEGAVQRFILSEAGYVCEVDVPDRPWGVRWVRA